MHKTNNQAVLQLVLRINRCYMQHIASREAEKAHATSCAPEHHCTPPKLRAIEQLRAVAISSNICASIIIAKPCSRHMQQSL
jgi:hypothetical protein